MKIIDLYDTIIAEEQYHGFLQTMSELGNNMQIFEFAKDDTPLAYYDWFIKTKIGHKNLFSFYNEKSAETFTNIYGVLCLHAYELNELYKSIKFEYNPIENYNMIETETIDGTINLGSQTSTNAMGATENKQTYGNREITNDASIATFDSLANVPSASNVEKVNTPYTDTLKGEAHTDTITSGAREDTNSTERELKRSGNIGVTTTQQMLESQRQLVRFTFANELVRVLNDNITEMLWGC